MDTRTVAESKPQIIVVEDDPMVGRTLCRLLTTMDVDAILVSSVNDALTHPGRFQSGFIVDYQLLDGTGIDVLEGLRREGVRGAALMYTAYASVGLASRAAGLGALMAEKAAGTAPVAAFVETVRHSRHRHARRRPHSLLCMGSVCAECCAAVTAQGVSIESHSRLADVEAALHEDPRAVVVVESEMPAQPGQRSRIDELLSLRERWPDVRLCYVAVNYDARTRSQALRAGARYVNHSDRDHVDDVRDMAVSLLVSPLRVTALADLAVSLYGLDSFQRRLLCQLLHGAPRQDIAAAFNVSVHDIKYHIRKLLRQAGAANAAVFVRRLYELEG